VLLRQAGVAGSPEDPVLHKLVGALNARVNDDGSIAFDPAAAGRKTNVWCAMFAEQALRWYADWCSGTPTARIEMLV